MLNIPPTKSNLITVKEQARVAHEGFELLEQKREILVMELMRMVEQIKLLEPEIEKSRTEAHKALKRMLLEIGREHAQETSRGIQYDFEIREFSHKIAGIQLPHLEIKAPELSMQYSLVNTAASCDQTMVAFLAYLKVIAQLAAIRTSVWRLAKEVKKTQRRVNALEKMVIPETESTIHYISGVLEEREREVMGIQKTLKKRMGGTKQ